MKKLLLVAAIATIFIGCSKYQRFIYTGKQNDEGVLVEVYRVGQDSAYKYLMWTEPRRICYGMGLSSMQREVIYLWRPGDTITYYKKGYEIINVTLRRRNLTSKPLQFKQ